MKSIQQNTIFKTYLIVLFVCIFTGCNNLVWLPDQPQVLLRQSEPQTLSIKNTHSALISLIPCKESDPVVNIPVEGEAHLKFRVVVVADLKQPQSWRPQWFEIASTNLIFTEPLDGPCYLRHGPDEVIMLDHQKPGEGKEIRINFKRCEQGRSWQDIIAPPAKHHVDSDQIAGIPVRVCPQFSN